jgi:hypothetical protein
MARKLLIAGSAAAVALAAAAVWAGTRVDADKENVVASRLEGKWKVNVALTQRLTGRKVADSLAKGWRYEFTCEPGVAALIPDKYDKFLKGKRVFMAGKMKRRLGASGNPESRPFLLIQHRGNPHVVYFRPKGDEPMGDAESFNVMLAVAKDRINDLLFIGGDFNNQPFSAFERETEQTELPPAAER